MPEQEQVKEQDQFEITTTAQVERTYVVTAANEEQAHARLRTHLKDADMLREGIVVEQQDKQTDSTPQRVKDVKKVARPRAVKSDAPAAAAG